MDTVMEVKDKIEDSLEHVGAYVQTRLDLLLLNVSDKLASSASTAVLLFVVWSLSSFVMIFLSLGLAWWIGQQLDNIPAGFFIVAGIYALLTVIIYVISKKVVRPALINKILKQWHHDR
jgi:hypothetical protein